MAKAVKQFISTGEFKISDLVVLKSGGPKMVIGKIDQWGVHCSWFNEDKRLLSASFPEDSLTKAKR